MGDDRPPRGAPRRGGRFVDGAFLRSDLAHNLILAAAYVAAARLGLQLAVPPGVATPVWAPTGISLAALLLFGPRVWPGVALGAFVANLQPGVPVAAVVGISVGNTLEALTGWFLLVRIARFAGIERVRDVVSLVTLGAFVSTTLSATIGVGSLIATRTVALSEAGFQWRVWWLGDATGELLVAPLLLAWATALPPSFRRRHAAEAVALAGALTIATWVSLVDGQLVVSYVLFPLLIWTALRFGQRGVTAAGFVVSLVAIWATLRSSVLFDVGSRADGLLLLQAVIAASVVTTLVIAAAISERDEQQQEAIRRLEQLDALRSEFMAVVSHDLKTPLNTIVGYASLVADSGGEHAREFADSIRSNALRVLAMTAQILAFARIELGQLLPHPTEFDLGALVRRTTEEMTVVSGRRFQVQVPDGLPPTFGDENHVWQVLSNVVSNAVKYSPEDAAVAVTVTDSDTSLEVAVADRGAGIPESDRDRLFDRFYRSPVTRGGTDGVGLGLYIARSLTEANGGRIWVESGTDGGTTFRFTVPRAPVAPGPTLATPPTLVSDP